VLTNHGDAFDGFGTPFVDHNGTTSVVDFETTVSANATATVSLSATGSFSLDAIVADAQGSVSATLALTVSISGSHSARIPTDPGQYAVAQFGDWRFYNYGSYEDITETCRVTQNLDFYSWLPEKAIGYDTATNSTGAIPWQQDNAN
jgi:hypothetical protein